MSKLSLTIIAVSVALLLLVGIVVVQKNSSVPTYPPQRSADRISENTLSATTQQSVADNIGSAWRWDKVGVSGNTADAAADQSSRPFTPKSVYDALQAVKLDDNGDVVLDHDALLSLDEALERIYNRLDQASATELQELIKSALPGKAGEQTAELVDDYRQFLRAKEEFSQMYENTANAHGEPTLQSLTSDQQLYSELQALREVYLGSETTKQLFQVSDANAEYMFESLKLGVDPSLSSEQIAARQQELQDRLKDQTQTQTQTPVQ
ncbi:lipase secretion chaperone [Arenicella xantha]|uniref:Lipase chaperone n=1 Tax=Arenicella xantha TaxID=644221 RepID=A0A395JIY9_9GAMM|nr:lipase secretion chaperone [Arenicella xantha]RBP50682.1 lipase chaperone protein [Arenicella xantha]